MVMSSMKIVNEKENWINEINTNSRKPMKKKTLLFLKHKLNQSKPMVSIINRLYLIQSDYLAHGYNITLRSRFILTMEKLPENHPIIQV